MSEEKPRTTEAQKRAKRKYMEKFVEIKVRMTPERRSAVQAHAEARGESVNGFINRTYPPGLRSRKAPLLRPLRVQNKKSPRRSAQGLTVRPDRPIMRIERGRCRTRSALT